MHEENCGERGMGKMVLSRRTAVQLAAAALNDLLSPALSSRGAFTPLGAGLTMEETFVGLRYCA